MKPIGFLALMVLPPNNEKERAFKDHPAVHETKVYREDGPAFFPTYRTCLLHPSH
jgi:hypothetical protein